MSKFKVGDRVKILTGCSLCVAGEIAVIHDTDRNGNNKEAGPWAWGADPSSCCHCENNWELIKNITPVGKNIMSNLTEKFVLALTPEPQKSYRKAGITNGDDVLTDEGVKVFLTWLLAKHPDFKTEVVEPILKEMAEEKK